MNSPSATFAAHFDEHSQTRPNVVCDRSHRVEGSQRGGFFVWESFFRSSLSSDFWRCRYWISTLESERRWRGIPASRKWGVPAAAPSSLERSAVSGSMVELGAPKSGG